MASTIPVAVGEARLKHKTQGGDLNQKNLNYDIQTHWTMLEFKTNFWSVPAQQATISTISMGNGLKN